MIIFDGIIHRDKMPFLRMKNEFDVVVEMPIDKVIEARLTAYIEKLVSAPLPEINRDAE